MLKFLPLFNESSLRSNLLYLKHSFIPISLIIFILKEQKQIIQEVSEFDHQRIIIQN